MSDLLHRTAALSPEKLALLQRRLKKARGGDEPSARKIPRREDRGPAPLSFAQERMWFLDQLQPGSPAYNVPESYPFHGPLDPGLLALCLREIADRHESLRTRFAVVDGRPVQVVEPGMRVDLPVADLAALPEERRQAELQRLAGDQVRQPFDLSAVPLWRVLLARLGPAAGLDRHVLLLTLHHIISDAWSIGVLFREMAALYEAYRNGRPAPLPELPIQYADFAAWQREWLQGERLDKLLDYWRQRLAGAPSLLALPTDRPRPAVQTFRGALRSFSVPAHLHRELKALGYRERTTLFMTLLAAFEVLLHRYTGQDDLVVATPIANRGRSEVEGLIGFFLNTLVLRTDLRGEPTFRQVMSRVREGMLAAHAHQDLPFEKLVQELRPDRNLSVNPLFQVMFVLQSAPSEAGEGEAGDAPPAASQTGTGTSRFDCTLSLVESGGRLLGTFEYNLDLFDPATIQRMEQHLLTLLGGIVADPDRLIPELPLLTAPERQLLAEWNDTAAPWPSGLCLHELFERKAAESPGAPALVFEDEQLTYAELNARANQVAHRLRALGVGPETRVGLLIDRSVEMIAGLLGILKAGGAYVPLDPAYPKDRLGFMLADARVPVLLTREALLGHLPEHEARVLCVDAERERLAAESRENLPGESTGVTPDHPAYVIYTSGSTGRPKGVAVPHRGACNAAEVEVRAYRTGPGDRVLQFASLNFDASVFELLMCFRGGATLCVARKDDLLPGPELARLLRERRITVLPIPPSALAAVPVEPLPDLRLILVMGESCPEELVERWQPVRFFNAYGPTEATIWSSGTFLEPGRRTTIGRPIANARIHLLDRAGLPVPIGVSGELCIGGIGVTRGYLDRPALTAERFVPDPSAAGGRLYRTGDLARWLPDGVLEFLGRIDHQVKIRGFRIELGEIEAVLSRCPGVREAVVIAREDLPTGRGLVAYVAVDPRRPPTAGELRRLVQERLPDYMVPAAFVTLEALPLTPSGKFDRAALPAPDTERPDLESAFVAPATSVEETLARIWAEVLGVQRVGVNDNFFELGGHSLLATQIVSRVRDAFRVELPLRRLFEAVTVQELARVVEREAPMAPQPVPVAKPLDPGVLTEEEVDALLRRMLVGQKRELLARLLGTVSETSAASAAPVPKAAPSAPPVPAQRTAPLSFAQERLWFLDRLRPGNRAYNIPVTLPLPPGADLRALGQALGEIVRRHESLRTTFALSGGRPVQVIAPDRRVPLPVIDLRELPEPARQAEMGRIAVLHGLLPFDLARGPLLRALVARTGEGEHLLLLALHHIVADGWSMGVLYRELGVLYEAFRAGLPSPLPAPPLQYADYAREQRERLSGDLLEQQLSYWREQLADMPQVLELPLDRPRPPVPARRGAMLPITLPPRLIAPLRELGQQQGTTLFMSALALVQALLWHETRQDRLPVGTPIAGRTRSELEGMIGFFTNTLVLDADFSQDPGFRQLLAQVRETALGAFAHQELPFEKLVETLQPERSLGVNPLFQVSFALETGGAAQPDPAEEPEPSPPVMLATPLKFDLSFQLAEAGSGLRGALEYDPDLFDDGTIRRLADHLRILLERVVAEPDRPLSEVSVWTAEELRAREGWNATDKAFEGPDTLHGLFEARAAATPDAVALSGAGFEMTFRELHGRAGRLARHLRTLGVGPEVPVALFLERSPEMIVGMLGVLLAGGAFVPIDPEQPEERTALILRDAIDQDTPDTALVLTRESLRGKLPGGVEARVLLLDGEPPESPAPPPLVPVGADGLAYIVYTSGSSGQPKGAMLPHGPAVNHMRWIQEVVRLTPEDVLLQKTPYHFDASLWEIFCPLMTGARLHLAPQGAHRDTRLLAEQVAAHGVTVLQAVPTLLHLLLDEPGFGRCASLRYLCCGGEVLRTEDARRFLDLHPQAGLVNLYGPTEAAIDATFHVCRRDETGLAIPIGTPIANLRAWLLDRRQREVPVGATGELCLGGAGLARGYLGRPDLTAERFLPDPFSAGPGGRMYRTGDLARRLSSGEIEYRGRTDDQIKVRGVRVEPGEIEAVLSSHPAVREAAVVISGSGAGVRLAACFVPRDEGKAPSGSELRAWLEQRLPQAMVPAAFVPLPALPRTPGGKLDRRALRSSGSAPDGGGAYVAPQGPVEEVLAGIWAEVLRAGRIGAGDDFFALGGHSLLAVQVLSRVRDALDLEWPLQRFFETPTLSDMAAALTREHGGEVERRARALLRLSRLSDDEVKTLLQEGGAR